MFLDNSLCLGMHEGGCFALWGTWRSSMDSHENRESHRKRRPVATALMTNKNPAQILDDYLFPGA